MLQCKGGGGGGGGGGGVSPAYRLVELRFSHLNEQTTVKPLISGHIGAGPCPLRLSSLSWRLTSWPHPQS